MKPWTIQLKLGKREITEGTICAGRELADLIREEIKPTQLEKNP